MSTGQLTSLNFSNRDSLHEPTSLVLLDDLVLLVSVGWPDVKKHKELKHDQNEKSKMLSFCESMHGIYFFQKAGYSEMINLTNNILKL